MEVVINKCYGGFSLSREGVAEYARLRGIELYAYNFVGDKLTTDVSGYFTVHYATKPCRNAKELTDNYFSDIDIPRNDPALVQTVKNLGSKANGMRAYLEIVEIPDGVEWEIEEYDGFEHVVEKHRTWG